MKRRMINTLILIFACFIASFLFPGLGTDRSIELILQIGSFLFAILIGFFISGLYTRFLKVRESVSQEVTSLTNFYLTAKLLADKNKQWFKNVVKLIDEYTISVLSTEWNEYHKTLDEFYSLFDSLKGLKNMKTNKDTETYTSMIPILGTLGEANMNLSITGQSKLSRTEWILIGFLSATIIFCLFYLKTPSIESSVFTGLFTAIILFMIVILKDFNDLRYGEEQVSFEPYERIFELIGTERFYHAEDVETGRVIPPKGIKYRTSHE